MFELLACFGSFFLVRLEQVWFIGSISLVYWGRFRSCVWFIGGYFGRVWLVIGGDFGRGSGLLVVILFVFLVYWWLFQRAEGSGSRDEHACEESGHVQSVSRTCPWCGSRQRAASSVSESSCLRFLPQEPK